MASLQSSTRASAGPGTSKFVVRRNPAVLAIAASLSYAACLDWRHGMSVQERVARGTRWLDGVRPGWRDALALGTLTLEHGGRCVLGQVFAEEAAAHAGKDVCGYRYVLNALITPAEWLEYPHWPSAHGFDRPPSSVVDEDTGEADAELVAQFAALEAEWRRMIHVPRDEFASPVLCR
jgi:hypothetical protein